MSSYKEKKQAEQSKKTMGDIGIVLLFAAFFIGIGALLFMYVPKLFGGSKEVDKPQTVQVDTKKAPENNKKEQENTSNSTGFGDKPNRTLK